MGRIMNKPADLIMCPCEDECPIGNALAVIGGKWKLRIICTLYMDGTQRYNDLVRKTTGITNAMLSSSLKDLEADGIIIRNQYSEIPPRVEYSLTEHGRELWPILHRFIHWAKNEEFDDDIEIIQAGEAAFDTDIETEIEQAQ
ncbi:MAG: helix-turn-helix transcriptional regulator [Lachnospiraceae bacterium]|nr:helix-turn-helix transcriptional regulator [Lachnospiraceae bacterium]